MFAANRDRGGVRLARGGIAVEAANLILPDVPLWMDVGHCAAVQVRCSATWRAVHGTRTPPLHLTRARASLRRWGFRSCG